MPALKAVYCEGVTHMFGSILDMIAAFALWIRDNDGTGDFSNFEMVFDMFGDLAGSVDGFLGS